MVGMEYRLDVAMVGLDFCVFGYMKRWMGAVEWTGILCLINMEVVG